MIKNIVKNAQNIAKIMNVCNLNCFFKLKGGKCHFTIKQFNIYKKNSKKMNTYLKINVVIEIRDKSDAINVKCQ